ncbi:plasmid pRiA4b ORF-3 family protein [Cytobacillus sp. S13-E01]|uniref:plasmid pRiA4b ORF-3 family protein n=1 Tax=Cytobacillus sp. S13-E01 TaxID=3031326 RepID=UPI0023D898B8|nr:plasmid pRiA4b ORF-3 family protein [Cytobacillus sp. S13-E01]MDF0728241.1 plasmid pRiA4b ORF-3 family protein [Cytobacillus sp. S13-E01]
MTKDHNEMKNNNGLNSKSKNNGQLSFDELWDVSEDIGKKYENGKKEIELETDNFFKKEPFPITLVRDFEQFISYVENHPIHLTKTMEYISRRHLPEINNRMTVRNEAATSHTEQEYYPYIHLFYFLGLSGQLLKKESGKGGKFTLEQADRLQLYKELTDIEKYFFLLEILWVDVNWARLLNERYNSLTFSLQEIFFMLSEEKEGYKIFLQESGNLKERILADRLDKWGYFLLYFEWFGFWECEIDQEHVDTYYRKNQYFAKSIMLTDFGSKVIPILLLDRNLQIWNIPERRVSGEVNPIPGAELEDMMYGEIPDMVVNAIFERMEVDQSSQPFFLPFKSLYPNESLHRTLPRNRRKFIEGIYTFRVSLSSGVWRKVVLSGKHTMEHLHYMIINSFDFDDDHLYSFFMDGKKWSNDCITSPHDFDEHPKSNKVQIGGLGLVSGQRFLYLYDFGDEWSFIVEMDSIRETVSEPFQPYVKESKGKAPDQYGEEEYW